MSDLDERMKSAGMMSVSEMLGRTPLDAFVGNAQVTDLKTFEEWVLMRREKFIRMQIGMTLDSNESDEMFEWVIAHNAILAEVIVNFRQAIGK